MYVSYDINILSMCNPNDFNGTSEEDPCQGEFQLEWKERSDGTFELVETAPEKLTPEEWPPPPQPLPPPPGTPSQRPQRDRNMSVIGKEAAASEERVNEMTIEDFPLLNDKRPLPETWYNSLMQQRTGKDTWTRSCA